MFLAFWFNGGCLGYEYIFDTHLSDYFERVIYPAGAFKLKNKKTSDAFAYYGGMIYIYIYLYMLYNLSPFFFFLFLYTPDSLLHGSFDYCV